jgi:preprotein translocase subunit SecF
MEFIKPGTLINVMRWRKVCVVGSLLACAAAIALTFYPGPNLGLDFAGGTELQVGFGGDVSAAQVRQELQAMGHAGAEVVSVEGNPNEYIIRVTAVSTISRDRLRRIREGLSRTLRTMERPCAEGEDAPCRLAIRRIEGQDPIRVSPGGDKLTFQLTGPIDIEQLRAALEGAGAEVRDGEGTIQQFGRTGDYRYEVQLEGVADHILDRLRSELGERGPERVLRIEWVGPKAGERLRDAAVKSLLYTAAFIMVYVAFRFDVRFAPGGIVALAHDVIVTWGVYVAIGKEVNLTTVAALLTILGFSINDTIVIYDRIRENMGRHRDKGLIELINLSTSQMLSRTIITSGTVLLSMFAFLIWGTPVIRDITFALIIGIIAGVYSTIFIAAPITEWMDRKIFRKVASAAAGK